MDFPNFLLIININLVIFLLQLTGTNTEIPRPRGVSLSRIGLYNPDEDFTCLDGSKTLPSDQVNDDYCDCPDGSDEPGTSACPGGSFYCTNAGHRPQVLPSDRVNDGICDCCDGSDEYSGLIKCSNNCLEVGRAAREEAVRLAELLKAGKQIRSDLSQEGQKMKNEKQEKIKELVKNKEEAEKVKAEREDLKKKAEEAENRALEYYRQLEEEYKKKKAEEEAEKQKEEALEFFKKLDSNQDGLVDVKEIQVRQAFDRDRNGEVSESEAKLFMANKESVDLEEFMEKTWKLMKPFLARDQGLYKPPSDGTIEQENLDVNADAENVEDEQDEEEEEEEDAEEKEADQEERPEEIPHIEYDEETQKLVDLATEARNQYSESERDVRDISDQIKQIEASLNKDFGPEEEFATLEGQCFQYQDHEYIYKLCPFDKSLQIPVSSSMETNLGRWARWDGPEDNPYDTMLYDQGQNCWNGPNRSTKVRVSCGTENKITAVSEPNRCEYSFDFQTPAACRDPGQESDSDIHDEL